MESTRDQQPQLYPQLGDMGLILCSVPNAVTQVGGKESATEVGKPQRLSLHSTVEEIREVIVDNPLVGAAQLSKYLATRNADLHNQVDLCRSELLRLQRDEVKYGELDSDLASQRQRRMAQLLSICHELMKTSEFDAQKEEEDL